MLKKSKVVMLTTNEQSTIFEKGSKLLEYNIHPPLHGIKDLGWKYQHLYILSDDKIEENDCILQKLESGNHKIHNNISIETAKIANEDGLDVKKIIATTDKLLILHDNSVNNKCFGTQLSGKCPHILPQPSDTFIQKYIDNYNKSNVITEVMVEYEEYTETTYSKGIDISYPEFKLKINPKDNTITIKRIKDSWNREEVEKLIELAWATASAYGDKTDSKDCESWIENNL
jgi:hypothetical protein